MEARALSAYRAGWAGPSYVRYLIIDQWSAL